MRTKINMLRTWCVILYFWLSWGYLSDIIVWRVLTSCLAISRTWTASCFSAISLKNFMISVKSIWRSKNWIIIIENTFELSPTLWIRSSFRSHKFILYLELYPYKSQPMPVRQTSRSVTRRHDWRPICFPKLSKCPRM